MAQTRDGYLWIGTYGGVYRFDGVTLALASFSAGNQMRSPRVVSLLAAKDGSLWVGTGSDLEHWDDNQLTHYPESPGFISGIAETQQGSIWFTRDRTNDGLGALCHVEGEHSHCFGRSAGVRLINSGLSGLPQDRAGHIWFGDEKTIYEWDPSSSRVMSILDIPSLKTEQSLAALQFDSAGNLLIGSQQVGENGLLVYDGGQIHPYLAVRDGLAKLSVSAILLDSHGALWIGTDNSGLYRVVNGKTEHYRGIDGLSGDGVTALYEDGEGNLWVATAGGLDRFRDLKVISYSTREGLSADQVNAVVGRRDGSVWLSNAHSLDVIRDGVVSSIRAGQGLPGTEVGPIFEDHTGSLWVGIDDALFIFDGKRFTKIMAGNPKNDDIRSITEDKSGMVWAMNDAARLFGFRNGKLVKELTNSPDHFADAPLIAPDGKEGVWLLAKNQDFLHVTDSGITRIRFHRAPNAANVYSLTTADDGSVLGGSAIGVVAVRGDQARTLGVDNGLPCPHVWSLIQASDSSLWLYTECGLLVLDKQEWATWWSNPTARVHPRVIDSLEGAQAANTFFTDTASRTPDGRLWFANSRVVQTIDPSSLKTTPKFAPVKIERVTADQNTFLPESPVHLPPEPRSLQIDYAAPSFSLASKTQFRYRLVGHDKVWVDAGTRRQAFYTDLPPGHYEFEVIASNSDGKWGSRAARIDLDVAPTFYQTKWFLAACIVAFGAVLWFLYLMRIRQLSARMQVRMEARLRERERIARDLHDTLLQGVQGLMYTFHAGIERIAKSEPTLAMLRDALVRADALMGEARAHVSGLRRPSVLPETLEDRLAALVSGMTPGVAAKIAITTMGVPRQLKPFVLEQIVRIAGEALQNAVRHAAASSIAIEMHFNEANLSVCVRDDGRGFDVEQIARGSADGHFGVIGMYERADHIGGQLKIVSRALEGTQVILQIPDERAYEASQPPGLRARLLRLWHSPLDPY